MICDAEHWFLATIIGASWCVRAFRSSMPRYEVGIAHHEYALTLSGTLRSVWHQSEIIWAIGYLSAHLLFNQDVCWLL